MELTLNYEGNSVQDEVSNFTYGLPFGFPFLFNTGSLSISRLFSRSSFVFFNLKFGILIALRVEHHSLFSSFLFIYLLYTCFCAKRDSAQKVIFLHKNTLF